MIADKIIHIALLLIFPPLLTGIINKVKAFFAGRKGFPLLQPYYDLFKLFRKNMVLSETVTWVFTAGPLVTLAAVFAAGLLVPLYHSGSLISFSGDFILFAYLFGLARFFTTAAALDTGSPFEGMGASREVSFAVLTEPALFFIFLVFARLTSSFELGRMLQKTAELNLLQSSPAPLIMLIAALVIILLAENCRIPVDDPATHLELTMIHEVMVLDHSGPLFGIIEYAAALKLFILASFLLTVVTPLYSSMQIFNWAVFAAGMFLAAIGIGIIESIMARLRMRRIPLLLISAILLGGSAFILFAR